jgi:FtsH-binding integral membrane protein
MTELDLLKKPEYIHVMLNHLPIYGTMLGALGLAISLALRSRAAQITALVITLIAGVSAYPVLVTGQRAYKTIRNVADDAGADALDEHMDRAEKTIGAFYFLAVLALAGLLVPIKWPKAGLPLAAATLAVAVICSGIAVYIAQAGGQVRHAEFRPSETPTPASESDHQHK